MKKKLFETGDQWTGLIARTALGLLMLPHGLQKTFGFFGGYGFDGTMNWFTGTMNIPWVLGAFIIMAEFLGAIALLAGLATRFWASVMIPLMIGAIYLVHIPHGWFMNWNGDMKGEGFEYHIAIIFLSIIVLINGGGKYAMDKWIFEPETAKS